MLLEKEAYINKIEAEVLDVNQIMQDLAEMVNAQSQSVGRNIFTFMNLLKFCVNDYSTTNHMSNLLLPKVKRKIKWTRGTLKVFFVSFSDTVESRIEAAGAYVESGTDELAKAAEHQRRYRKKMFILILIAMIIGIVLVVWIVRAFR